LLSFTFQVLCAIKKELKDKKVKRSIEEKKLLKICLFEIFIKKNKYSSLFSNIIL